MRDYTGPYGFDDPFNVACAKAEWDARKRAMEDEKARKARMDKWQNRCDTAVAIAGGILLVALLVLSNRE